MREGCIYVRLSCRHYMPHLLGSISSLFLFPLITIITQIIISQLKTRENVESLICQKDKAKECLGHEEVSEGPSGREVTSLQKWILLVFECNG
jgi:hypothetical protein